jgi:flagellar protein FliO/FliZ
MNAFDFIRAVGSLLLVIGIILGLAWVMRRYGAGVRSRAGLAPSDLRVVEWRTLDVRRKLAVIHWDGREHLLCLGPTADILIAERTDPPPFKPEGFKPETSVANDPGANDGGKS